MRGTAPLSSRGLAVRLSAAAAVALLSIAAPAQDAVKGYDLFGPPVLAKHVSVEEAKEHLFVPQPPKALVQQEVSHPKTPVPIGTGGNPQPNTPQTVAADPGAGQPNAGVFTYFQNSIVKPSGASVSWRTPEPGSFINQDTAFQTGNWYAALSPDNGETWTHVNPATFFPSIDGGFCCDQKAIYVNSHNLAVWVLQYSDNGSKNTLRIAVATTRAKLRSGLASDWDLYDFNPQQVGWPTGHWFDYPDLAYDGANLHLCSNVFPVTTGTSGGARIRIPLASLQAGNTSGWSYASTISGSGALVGRSYRFAQSITSTTTMWFANHATTTSLYLYEYDVVALTTTRYTKTVAAWSNTTMSAPCPDARDWAGFSDHRIYLGYGNSTEVGFGWDCDVTTGRPWPYTRVARFRISDNALLGEHDIWNGSDALMYAAAATNSSGHVGFTIQFGGPTRYIASFGTIIDNYQPWGGLTLYGMGAGSSGPSINRWGDYFMVMRHPENPSTFVGNGMSLSNSTTGNPRWVWFGRDDYTPTWVNLFVDSTPVTGVPITIDVTDRNGAKNGNTNFTRVFAPQQGYEVVAPKTFTSGSVYVFDRWAYKSTPASAFVLQPVDQLNLEIANCSTADDTCEARYVLRRTLSVQSTNPASGVAITVSNPDINGASNGSTAFTRLYKDAEVVTLTAPITNPSGIPFKRWRLDGVNQALGVTALNVTMNAATRTAIADYYVRTTGSATNLGTACVGTTGLSVHTALAPKGYPFAGDALTLRLSNARASTAAALYIGASKTNWGPYALPLNLAFIGIPNCFLYTSIDANVSTTTSAAGVANVVIPVPNIAAIIGGHVYSQYAYLDTGAPYALPIPHSNALDLLFGGDQ